MRIGVYFAVAIGLSTLAGCATFQSTAWNTGQNRQLKPHLLFDRFPGKTFATSIEPRSSWPFTVAGQQQYETIEFQERFTDYQGQSRNIENEIQRRFTTIRRGRIER